MLRPLPAAGPWDLFCRVIDNHGDLGVCWRLARGLAGVGATVRLWVDAPGALAWMAPQGHAGVQVLHWTDPPPDRAPGAVVVEAFGCDPPPAFVARMAAMAGTGRPPVWINLEYLSAEPYVERSHGLASPQWSGPGRGLTKWFFYPGFTRATGGLLHGDLADAPLSARPPRAGWARALGLRLPAAVVGGALPTPPGATAPARLVLLFGYRNPQWPALLHSLADGGPTHLLVPPGIAQDELAALSARPGWPAALTWQPLPLLAQPDFDTLLAGCDLVVVRGEDSFVRAQLAGDTPFLWQIYPQNDGAHAAKLEAFLQLYLAKAPAELAPALAATFRALNGLGPWPVRLPDAAAWRTHQRGWRAQQLAESSLLQRLWAFVCEKSTPAR